jgi:hypothetical protein
MFETNATRWPSGEKLGDEQLPIFAIIVTVRCRSDAAGESDHATGTPIARPLVMPNIRPRWNVCLEQTAWRAARAIEAVRARASRMTDLRGCVRHASLERRLEPVKFGEPGGRSVGGW